MISLMKKLIAIGIGLILSGSTFAISGMGCTREGVCPEVPITLSRPVEMTNLHGIPAYLMKSKTAAIAQYRGIQRRVSRIVNPKFSTKEKAGIAETKTTAQSRAISLWKSKMRARTKRVR